VQQHVAADGHVNLDDWTQQGNDELRRQWQIAHRTQNPGDERNKTRMARTRDKQMENWKGTHLAVVVKLTDQRNLM